ncbi:type II toxin-antitoxin system RelE/ParE family toxin [Flavisolibacter sp. BT320]|nr:type II toxin-antitoxin system RelE/ParE family toxin [Flavisolibacter longurius]
MAWKVQLTQTTRDDIYEIKQWYRQQSGIALKNFVEELVTAIDNLKSGQVEHRIVYKDNRKLPLRKFPYSIYYRRKEKEEIIIINAVLHNRREIGFLQDKLDKEV